MNLPRISLNPSTLPINIPMVTKSWCPVPNAPRKLYGAISDRNIGANCAAKPVIKYGTNISYKSKSQQHPQLMNDTNINLVNYHMNTMIGCQGYFKFL